jgi:hypothetical protein
MKDLLRYLTPGVILAAILIALGMLLAAFLAVWAGRPASQPAAAYTAVMTVIAAPTATPTATPVPQPTATEALEAPPAPPPGVIAVGAFVQITGTGGDGLRLRAEPGLGAVVQFLGLEAEVFEVIDGPREVDGYTWWYLAAPFNGSLERRGWAVANYLGVVQNP